MRRRPLRRSCGHRDRILFPSARRRSRRSGSAGKPSLVAACAQRPLQFEIPDNEPSFTVEHAIGVLSQKLDRLHTGQLVLCAQVKDLRESLPMQRRPLSKWTQQVHIEVVWKRRNGICPACQEVPIVNEHGRLPGLEFDHWYARNRARPKRLGRCSGYKCPDQQHGLQVWRAVRIRELSTWPFGE